MSCANIVDLCSDDEFGENDVKPVEVEGLVRHEENHRADLPKHQKSKAYTRRQDSDGEGLNDLRTCQSGVGMLDQQLNPIDDSKFPSTSPMCSPPICRQFWKAGNYNEGLASKSTLLSGGSYLHIHPKFLHSNATSHKWAFGAIAELLDNAVDEVQNGATFVIVDKTRNPRDGSPALLIQDDGGGMDPEAMRRCLSFGFSDKKSKSAIGRYGNGFKTSYMRLGADVIVFSRHLKDRKLTQSIGLLSYTFLTQTGHDRIVVPMVDYEFTTSTGSLEILQRHGKDHFGSNLSMLLQWSPYSTEAELMTQFDDIGYHGTKIVIYNLWFVDDGITELDFDSDPEDICLHNDGKILDKSTARMKLTEQHMANRLRYSLRVYLSILYLRIPENFSIILRGRVVEYHNFARDLKFPEFIVYKPQSGGTMEGKVITTIGFLKEAPHVNIHGFNVYHKNRLILPFWRVLGTLSSVGRGVVGVLEADFIEPTHNKQDFEKTPLFQKLEQRLKDMTREYWDYHCGLIGYHQVKTKPPAPGPSNSDRSHNGIQKPVVLAVSPVIGTKTRAVVSSGLLHPVAASTNSLQGSPGQPLPNLQGPLKRKECNHVAKNDKVKRMLAGANVIDTASNLEIQHTMTMEDQLEDQEAQNLRQENKRLRGRCLDAQKREEELNFKVTRLRAELEEAEGVYAKLLAEVQSEKVKEENAVKFC